MTGKGVEPLAAYDIDEIILEVFLLFEIIQELSWMNYGDFRPISVYARYHLLCVILALLPVFKAYDLKEIKKVPRF